MLFRTKRWNSFDELRCSTCSTTRTPGISACLKDHLHKECQKLTRSSPERAAAKGTARESLCGVDEGMLLLQVAKFSTLVARSFTAVRAQKQQRPASILR